MVCNALDNIICILNDLCIVWVRNPLESPMSQCVTSRSTQFVTPLSQYATRRTRTGVNAACTQWTNIFLTYKKILKRATLTYCTDSSFRDSRIRKRYIARDKKSKNSVENAFLCYVHWFFAVKYTFTKGFTNASLRRFCCLFVSCLWIKISWTDIYAEDTYTGVDDCVII